MAGEDTFVGGLARRYAAALFDLADSKDLLDVIAEDLRGLKALIAESDELQRLINSPLYDSEQQSKAVAAVLAKAGVNDLTQRFVGVVANNRRLFALPEIINGYLNELAQRRGEVTAEVTSAHALDDAQQKALTEALNKAIGGKVNVNLTVDADLLGGLIVKVGSRMIDSSVRSKLQRLQFAMKGVG
ncbi:F0F1 ATP synthase subunit delta [Rhodovibrionaceae bacterium A322]